MKAVNGVNIKIGADTTSVGKALRKSREDIKGTYKELSILTRALKNDPSGETLGRAFDTANKRAKGLEDQLEILKKGLVELEKEPVVNAEAIKRAELEILDVNNKLNTTQKIQEKLNDGTYTYQIAFEKINDEIKNAGDNLNFTTREAQALQKSLGFKYSDNKMKSAMDAFGRSLDEANQKLQLQKQKLIELEKQGVNKNTKAWKEANAEVAEMEAAVHELAAQFKQIQNVKFDNLNNLSNKLTPLSIAAAAGLGLMGKAAVEFEDAFSNVEKTVDATKKEFEQISDEIREMSRNIPTSAAELANIAGNAGQLGVEKQNVTAFTRTIADLGVATDLAGETAAMTAAQFANITKMDQTKFSNLGSSIVELGNNFATTESKIFGFAEKMGAAAYQAGMTQAEILGISTVFSSLGLEAEGGGTAVSRMLSDMQLAVETGSGRLKELSAVAGMTADEFATAFKENAAGALVLFIEGLGAAGEAGTSATKILNDLGVKETRMADAFKRAATSSGEFSKAISMSNGAWEQNTALTEEANKKYGNTASQLKIAKNNLNDIGISLMKNVIPMVKTFTDFLKGLSSFIDKLPSGLKNVITSLLIFTATIVPAMKATSALGTTFTNLKVSALTAIPALGGQAAAQTGVGVTATGASVGVTKLGASVALATGGISLIIPLIIGLVTAFSSASSAVKEAEEANKKYKESLDQIETIETDRQTELASLSKLVDEYDRLNSIVNKTATEKALLKSIVEEINTIMPGAISNIVNENDAYSTTAESVRELIGVESELAHVRAAQDIYSESLKEQGRLQSNLAKQQKELIDTTGMTTEEFDALIEKYGASNGKLAESTGLWREIASTTNLTSKKAHDLVKAFDVIHQGMETNSNDVIFYKQRLLDLGEELEKVTEEAEKSAQATKSMTAITAENAEAVKKVTTDLDAAAGAYQKLSEAQEVSIQTTSDIAMQYGQLIIEQSALIAKNPQLLANIDSENSARQNALAMQQSIFNIKKELAIAEIKTARDSTKAKIAEIEAAGIFAQADGEYTQFRIKAREDDLKSLANHSAHVTTYYNLMAQAANAARIKDLKSQVDNFNKLIKDLEKSTASTYTVDSSKTKTAEEKRVEEFQKLRKELEFQRDMDYISEATFYSKLSQLQGKYLTKNSEEWRKVQVDIKNFNDKTREEQLKTASKQAEDRIKQLEKQLKEESDLYKKRADESVKEIDKLQKAEEKRLKAVISGIDEEIAKRRQLREDDDWDDKIARAKKSLEAAQAEALFARDDNDRIEKEKEVIRKQDELNKLQKDYEDELWYRSKESEKDDIQKQIDLLAENTDKIKAAIEAARDSQIANSETRANSGIKLEQLRNAAALNATNSSYSTSNYNTSNTTTNSKVNHLTLTQVFEQSMTSGQLERAILKLLNGM